MRSRFVLVPDICGRRVIGLTAIPTLVITGCRARGWKRPRLGFSGRRAIGAGITERMFSTTDIGGRTLDFMAAWSMDSDMTEWDLRAVSGAADLSITTAA
jgi:hypothetical protein